ncbi:MAG TPA: acyloxyacyl hydrolase [Acidobacteriaceae bacterium]|nr:acyloxyacyl hydrolase [Acidobacteriaceae bacterium]
MCLPKFRVVLLIGRLCGFCLTGFLLLVSPGLRAQNQADGPYYARRNTFGFFTAYSNDSSHILLGNAENRKLFELGAFYDRRLLLGRVVNWQYSIEVLPVALESDPVTTVNETITLTNPPPGYPSTGTETIQEVNPQACQPVSGSGSFPGLYSYTYTATCSRRWTMGEAMAPVGFQWNFLPRRSLQPFAVGHGGYMFSTQPIPTTSSGSFNFTFDFGGGVELYLTRSQSIRAEYRFHHTSNAYTAAEDPGIDNGLFQLTWAFGH